MHGPYWGREGGIANVKCRNAEQDITTKDNYSHWNCIAMSVQDKKRDRNRRGNNPFIVNVTVNVVISVLSAAGSRIVPNTDCILNRRAKYPSALTTSSISHRHPQKCNRQTKSVRPAYTKREVAI